MILSSEHEATKIDRSISLALNTFYRLHACSEVRDGQTKYKQLSC